MFSLHTSHYKARDNIDTDLSDQNDEKDLRLLAGRNATVL